MKSERWEGRTTSASRSDARSANVTTMGMGAIGAGDSPGTEVEFAVPITSYDTLVDDYVATYGRARQRNYQEREQCCAHVVLRSNGENEHVPRAPRFFLT